MKQVPTQVQVTFKFARMRTADNSIYFILNATYCITVQRLLQSTELFVKKTVCLVHVAHLDPVIQYVYSDPVIMYIQAFEIPPAQTLLVISIAEA